MGRVGSCYVNAVAESFLASLKAEIGTRVWATRSEAHRAVFAYITYYNQHRLHSTLKRQTPYEARACYRKPSPSRHETPVSGPGVELHADPPNPTARGEG
jgi:transposase InsO family protein